MQDNVNSKAGFTGFECIVFLLLDYFPLIGLKEVILSYYLLVTKGRRVELYLSQGF